MKLQAIIDKFNNKRYVSIIILVGILLMTLPRDVRTEDVTESINGSEIFSLEKEEERLEHILSSIDGVGECRVLLSIQNGSESVLAERDGDTIVISNGGKQSTVTVQTKYPQFKGAVVVCGGTDKASVRHDILASVKAYTGLEVDRITICPIKNR